MGTAIGIAGMNYTGPYAESVSMLMTAFNGEAVSAEQGEFDALEDYDDIYMDSYEDVPVYDETYSDDTAFGQTSSATMPTIDAALISTDSAGQLTLLDNGATLRGPGNGYAGDRIGVAFMPVDTAYVYIVAIDGTGWTQALFPDPALGHSNPVFAGTEILLPGEALYGLDDVPGVETIYILASNQPRNDLSAQLGPFFGKERPAATGAMTYRAVERPIIISRGLTGVRPGVNTGTPSMQTSSLSGVPLNTFMAAQGANEIALTLWFNHE
jgi:hypothetical protein